MCFAAGIEAAACVFGHGFVYIKDEETGDAQKISKSLGNVVEPMEIVTKFTRRRSATISCAMSVSRRRRVQWKRFEELYNADLANNLGNTYSRVVKLISQHYDSRLEGTAGLEPGVIYTEIDIETTAKQVQTHVEACQYNQADCASGCKC